LREPPALGYRSPGKLARPLDLAGQAERPVLSAPAFRRFWGQCSPISEKTQYRGIPNHHSGIQNGIHEKKLK